MVDNDAADCGNRMHAQTLAPDGIGKLLQITIAGMDQTKFRRPINIESNAKFDNCWRRQLRVDCCITQGHIEALFVMGTEKSGGLYRDLHPDRNVPLLGLGQHASPTLRCSVGRLGTRIPRILMTGFRIQWCPTGIASCMCKLSLSHGTS